MHDSVTHDFDRVSDFNDNGSTPLQGQQDEQPEAVNSKENAIDNDVVDIMTLYPPWSTDTNDIGDNNQVVSDRNRKEIQDELYVMHRQDRLLLSQLCLTSLQFGRNKEP